MSRRPGRTERHPAVWTVMIIVLVFFAGALAVNGVVHSQYGADHRVAPPAGTGTVPRRIPSGGPIIEAGRQHQVAPGTAILTFDDGPNPEWTPKILAVLRRHRVPGTFFVIGSAVARHPGIVRDMRRSGAEIGIHTFTHPDLGYADPWRRRMEMSESQLAVAGAAGVTSSLARPPYSSTADAIDDHSWPVVAELGAGGYVTVLTTHDTRDWSRPGVDRIVRSATPAGGAGAVILMHDAGGDRSQTVTALDRLIPLLKARGYRFSTVAQAAGWRTANPDAPRDERYRGVALLALVQVADVIGRWFALLLAATGILVLARLALMLLLAGRHAHARRPGHRWGPPVTEPVSVVIPAYDERACIAHTVRSVIASDHSVEVVVVDDGSTDGTADVVDRLGFSAVRVIRRRNGGKAAALNAGIAAARHGLVVLLDADTAFAPGTVRRLVQPFADPRVGAVSGNAKVANRRGLIARWQHIEYVVGFNIDRRVYDVLRCMPTVPGAVGAFRRRALDDAGPVSGGTLAEDTDLTMAVIRAGWRVVYEPSAQAWTEVPATIGQLWRQRYRWSYGTMQAMWKHRRALIERGPSGRLGRVGLTNLALFQVALPLLAPLIDVFLLYGLLFLDPARTALAWLAVLGAQLIGAVYAFRLDHEPLRALWALPLQQLVYRQLMYAVLIQSVITALSGMRMRWHKLHHVGAPPRPAARSY